ncbi:tetratricopeptide repeat protein [Abyssalbus ytuae]|uniref:Tetratricopeptide repeat protein n=1 Tax=Abyssalbus ytuae TaxID=2926907 RepID=A0A9E6ZYF0_9FLAO|nr:hypothetical protein [Abyssalbus ytuae]UOB17497.1 hypothetical protein MQE35_17390 [Abyssalbus ytuae]
MGDYINNYVFKALENYPYDLEEVMEALNYALSYDEKNTMALTLKGRVYAEKLYKYEEAISYYKQVLAENISAFEVYSPYINTLFWNEDYKEAEQFINFALTVKGSDKALLYLKKAILNEQLRKYKKALKLLKVAEEHTFNNEFISTINSERARIKGKIPKKENSEQKKRRKK